ncbi:exportin-2-like [Chenopodium quinoa]|uniref:exportin-2-like n=1 Tax=Chenopodium quinoa TaxID=63459 RepID=UPI000B77874F|nr:exportin-2-like [Chenopodium quinoa]
MATSPETLEFLSKCFMNSLSPNHEPRRQAEASLGEAAEQPNYGLAVLTLIRTPGIGEEIQQAAAVNFKNFLKARWAPAARRSEPNVPLPNPIPDTEKKLIKEHIVSLMLESTPRIQSQLSEALVVIGKHDFPRQWTELLPMLNSRLQQALTEGGNYAAINGILGTANSLFKKFRHGYGTNDLRLDLRYCLDNMAVPLLQLFSHTASLIDSGVSSGASAANLKPLFESQRLCCRIFYSFNFQELPDLFEDNMEPFINVFGKYLTTTYPALEQGGEQALVDNLRAAICEILTLYVERTEEPFERYVGEFEKAVRSLLITVSGSPGRDHLAITAIKFLTMVSTMAHHYKLFDDASLDQICRSIVIPNVMLREEDEELFEFNYIEFIRRDMEGSDVDTKRRAACELLKGIATHYREKVAPMVNNVIQTMLAKCNENPALNWKYKDSAIYLVISLSTVKATGPNVLTGCFDLQSFFTLVVAPELQSQDVNSFPLLKAGALKFLTVFRDQLPKSSVMSLLPEVLRFLGAESNVIHSYAAIFIDKVLLVKDEGGRARYVASDIAPFLPVLLNNLFIALKFPESEENQYVMKCIMRVLGVADVSGDVAATCMSGMASILNEVCKNPKNPIFNHYLFEAVAVLIRRVCDKDPSVISLFETSLFPSLQTILTNNVIEFFPYAFQLLAQLVELNRPPLPPHYMQFFELLLLPDLWTKSADVPALVRLLQAFLRMAPNELNQGGKLDEVLNIYSKLLPSSRTEEQAFFVLNTVVENLGYEVIAGYLPKILVSLFTRLQTNQTPKFVRCFIIFMSLVIVKHGWNNLVDAFDRVQPGILLTILEVFWVPNLKQITGATETKLTAVASTKLLCECPALLKPESSKIWGKMLDSIVTLVTRPEEERVEEESEVPDFAETGSYSATFIRLYNVNKRDDDPLKEIKDPKQFLLASLRNLSDFSTGRYGQVISENVDPANQAALSQLYSTLTTA